MEKLKIGDVYKDVKVDEHNIDFVNTLIKLNNDDSRTKLVVMGDVGVGKTYVVRKLLDHDYYISEDDAKQQVAALGFSLRTEENRSASIDKYPLECLSKKLTIIYDDIGTANLSEAMIEKTLYRLNKRSATRNDGKKYRTIITTNQTLEKLRERESRIASRVLEGAIIIEVLGPDRRALTAKKITL